MSDPREDIALMVGGNFNAASVGPEAVEALAARVRADPDAYLGALRDMLLGDAFDPKVHGDYHLAALLGMLAEVRPDAVRSLVATLLRLYDGVLIPFDAVKDPAKLDTVMDEETVNLLYRLNTRRLELRALAGTLAGAGGGQ